MGKKKETLGLVITLCTQCVSFIYMCMRHTLFSDLKKQKQIYDNMTAPPTDLA